MKIFKWVKVELRDREIRRYISLIERIEKENALHSIIGKYYNSLGADKLSKILADCKGRGKIFTTENNLAAYLQACTQNNGKLTDNLPEIKEGAEKWMQ